MIEYIESINDLNYFEKEELIDVIEAYNKYVVDFYDEHDEGSYPVSIIEFVNLEYPIIKKEDLSFIDDTEKMIDFLSISRTEFLNSYEYLSEMEYDVTRNHFEEDRAEVLANLIREAENIHIEEMNGRSTSDVSSEALKTAVTNYLPNLNNKEKKDFEDYCVSMAV